MTAAQLERRSVVEHRASPAAAALRALWDRVGAALAGAGRERR